MSTLIYICYVTVFVTPITQKCHLEEVIHGSDHNVATWCQALSKLSYGDSWERLTVCRRYRPGEDK